MFPSHSYFAGHLVSYECWYMPINVLYVSLVVISICYIFILVCAFKLFIFLVSVLKSVT
jgi:hypothetical protein